MTDPYKVLEVSPNATDDQVKTAYRELARKYHPDRYVNNPLADLAQEKMKEINEAYDQIQRQRKQGSSSGKNYSDSGSYQPNGSALNDIRRMINMRRITEAEELLDGIPASKRDGEWHFLKGSIAYQRGWLDDAHNLFEKACTMSPGNQEYRAAFTQMSWQRNNGTPYGSNRGMRQGGYGAGGCTPCEICQGMICADFLCDCMGGGC